MSSFGTATFTLQLRDAEGMTASGSYRLNVAALQPRANQAEASQPIYTFPDGVGRTYYEYYVCDQYENCGYPTTGYLSNCNVYAGASVDPHISTQTITGSSGGVPDFSLTFTANTTTPPGSRSVSCTWDGQSISIQYGLQVYDATPQIHAMSPSVIAANQTTGVTFTGVGFGIGSPTLAITPAIPYTVATGNSPTSFTAYLTPSAAGSYSIAVQSTGNGTTGQFQPGEGSTSQGPPQTLTVVGPPTISRPEWGVVFGHRLG